MNKVRIGVLGGYRGSSMINYCKRSDNAEVVAICDKWPEALEKQKKYAEGLNITYYDNLAAAATENLEDGLADSIEDVTARILSGEGFKGKYTQKDVSNVRTAVSGAQKYGGRDASKQLENILGQAGDKAGLLAAEFANIDWSNVSIDELESIV